MKGLIKNWLITVGQLDYNNIMNIPPLNVTDPFAKSRKVYFKDDKIPFDGVPFSIIGTKVFDCQHGPDRKKAFKARLANDKVFSLQQLKNLSGPGCLKDRCYPPDKSLSSG